MLRVDRRGRVVGWGMAAEGGSPGERGDSEDTGVPEEETKSETIQGKTGAASPGRNTSLSTVCSVGLTMSIGAC